MGLVKLIFFVNFIERGCKVKSDFYDEGGRGAKAKSDFDDEGGRGGKPKSDF